MHCYDYRKILEDKKNKDKSKKNNPVPEDAILLRDLYGKSTEEILGIVNYMGRQYRKSDIRVMYSHGFGFTWGELVTVADLYGLQRTSGKARLIQYEIPTDNNNK